MGYNLPFTFSGVCSYSFASSSFLARALLPLQDQRYLIVTRCPDLDLLQTALRDSSAWFLSHLVASYLKRQVPTSFFSSDQDEVAVHFLDTEHRVAASLDEHTNNRMYSLAFVVGAASPFDFVSFLRDPDLAWRFARMDQLRLGQFYRAFSDLESAIACDRTRRASVQYIQDEGDNFSTFAALAAPIFACHIRP